MLNYQSHFINSPCGDQNMVHHQEKTRKTKKKMDFLLCGVAASTVFFLGSNETFFFYIGHELTLVDLDLYRLLFGRKE